MKRLKHIALLLVAGFFAFAPPGTLIFGALLVATLVKNFWLRLALVALVALLAALFLRRLLRARRAKPQDKASTA